MAYRIDFGSLGKVKRTPQGGIEVPASLTRSGIFVYRGDGGEEIREYRPPEEVFKADSLRSLANAPVTDRHPSSPVGPKNFRHVARGNVIGLPRQDGDHVAATLAIQDQELLGVVERRDRTQVSCGYQIRIDETPGVTPGGKRYDRVQRDIEYNHVAIVEKGRAGSEVGLRLDSSGDQVYPAIKSVVKGKQIMFTIRIDGQDWPLGTDEEKRAAIQAMERHQARLDSESGEATKKIEKEKARADAAEEELTEAKKLANPEEINKRVQAALDLRKDAAPILGDEYVFEGKSELEIKSDVSKKIFPNIRLDDQSDTYKTAMYDAALQTFEKRKDDDPEGLGAVRRAADQTRKDTGGKKKTKSPSAEAKRRMDKANVDMASAPLALSKDQPAAN